MRTQASDQQRSIYADGLVLAGLCLPWLSPFAFGPSPAALQFLLTLGCVAVVLLMSCVRHVEIVRSVVRAWLLAALLSSVIGLCQYFGVEQLFTPWMSPSLHGEAFANLRQRNHFATLCNIGLAALLWWAVTHGSDRTGPATLVAAGLLVLGNAASASRTGLLGLVLVLMLAAIWGLGRRPWIRELLVTALVAYAGATLMLPVLAGHAVGSSGLLSRFHSTGPDCASRLTLWRNMLELIGQRPWLGWGWGELDYAHFITQYDGVRQCELLDNAHNLPLHLAVELGLPAAVLICVGSAWLILRAKPWRELDATRQVAWMVLALILLHSMLEYPLWYGPFQMALGLSLLLLWPLPGQGAHIPGAERPVQGRWWPRLLAAVLLTGTAYAAWDYCRISQIYLPPARRMAAYRDDTLEKIRGSWLFRDQVQFAELTLTPLTHDSAARLNAMAQKLMHFSPEARVVETLIESAMMLGRDAEVRFFMARYQAAYPQEYARWVATRAQS